MERERAKRAKAERRSRSSHSRGTRAADGTMCASLGGGWLQRTECSGKWQRAGLHTLVEGTERRALYVCTLTQDPGTLGMQSLSQGQYELCLQAKCVSSPETTGLAMHIVFGYRSRDTFLCLHGDVQTGWWSLEQRVAGETASRLLASVDGSAHNALALRPNAFYDIVITARAHEMCTRVVVNGFDLFNTVTVAPVEALVGDVGVAAQQSRMVFKNFALQPLSATSAFPGTQQSSAFARATGSTLSHKAAAPQRRRQPQPQPQLYQPQPQFQPQPQHQPQHQHQPQRQHQHQHQQPALEQRQTAQERACGIVPQGMMRAGAMVIPERFAHAAERAGLGGSRGVYGHMRAGAAAGAGAFSSSRSASSPRAPLVSTENTRTRAAPSQSHAFSQPGSAAHSPYTAVPNVKPSPHTMGSSRMGSQEQEMVREASGGPSRRTTPSRRGARPPPPPAPTQVVPHFSRRVTPHAEKRVGVSASGKSRYCGEDSSIVEAIERDIIDRDLGVTFDDIAALGTYTVVVRTYNHMK